MLDEGLPLHPLQEQRDSVKDWRQTGCGIFGLADMLIKMNIRYGSKEALQLCNEIGFTMADAAISASSVLAYERGRYPKYDESVLDSKFFNRNTLMSTAMNVETYGLHNSQLLTIAPTGSLSSMIGVSGGIEPIYANYYERKTESLHGHDKYYKVYTPIVKKYMEEHGLEDDSELPDYFVTAQTLDYRERIDMQAVWQEHIDASISSTVNVPNDFTVEQVEDLYLYAWKKGLKGVTIYRDGCKRSGILSVEIEKKHDKYEISGITELPRGYVISVSDDLISYKRTIKTGCGKMYLHIDFDENTGEPLESWIDLGSGGGCERNLQFISRLISSGLRYGMPLSEVIEQAKSIRPCLSYVNRTKTHGDTSPGTSCPGALGIALQELQNKINERCFVNEEEEYEVVTKKETKNKKVSKKKENKLLCPECGEPLSASGGCFSCTSCSYSKCE